MLRILREHATSWMLRGILILVALTFISWGGYSLIREKKETYAAKVNGEVIDMKDYVQAYQAMVKQYRDALGASFNEKMAEDLRLRERALDNLVTQVLMIQEAKRLRLDVSNDELRASIESIPYFQTGGQFDRRNYERFLRSNWMSAEDFERLQRDRLLTAKVVNLIRFNGGKLSEDETLEFYRFENERLNLNFIKISPEAYKGQVTVNEIDEKDYYQKHQEEFRIPSSARVQYLLFRPSDFEGKVQVTSEEVQRFYDRQKDAFKTPKRVKAREILLEVSAEDNADQIEAKKKRAEEILEEAKRTQDFAALAKKYSQSATASKGGEMGWIQEGTLEPSLQAALFALKPGEVSGLVKGGPGFYIFKADEVVEERQKSLEEVREQIAQGLKRDKARKAASRSADDAFYAVFRNRDLETYAKEKGLPIKTTSLFKEGDELPELGRNPAFQSAAFALKVGEISAVVDIPPNFYILKLLEKKESRVPPLEEVRNTVRQKVVALKAQEKAGQVADELLKQIQGGKEIKEVAQEKGVPVGETGFFTRASGAVPKIGPSGELTAALSSVTEDHRVPKEVLRTKDGFFVVKLLAREAADETKFPGVKKDLERELSFQKQEVFFGNWLDQLKTNAKIEINQDALKS
jgi:peptidyl-prolyl cis-trans isomerase D